MFSTSLVDLEQPSELELRLDAALKRAENVNEGRLHGVLRFLAVAKSGKAECEDALAVLFIQVPGQLGRMGRALGLSGHLLPASVLAIGLAIAQMRRWPYEEDVGLRRLSCRSALSRCLRSRPSVEGFEGLALTY